MAGAAREPMRAVVLLSGGIDSYTAGALARSQGRRLYALSVDYGQRHSHELQAAAAIAKAIGAAGHVVLDVDLAAFGGSALTAAINVPKDRALDRREIPVTYVPARNTVFLSLALAWAEVLGAEEIVIGVNAVDYSGYPDCRPEFLAAFERLAALATKAGVEGGSLHLSAPLMALSKADIIRLGTALGLDYGLTHSCYDPRSDGAPCRHCDSCRLREEGFRAAGFPDPLLARFPSAPSG